MKKFNIEVTRTSYYEVEVDENLWNEKIKESFECDFFDLPDADSPAEAFARGLAEQSALLGVNQYIDGFGKCATDKDYEELWNVSIDGEKQPFTNGLYIHEVDNIVESKVEDKH